MASYAVPSDIPTYGINAAAIAVVPSGTQQAALDAASDTIDGYLRSQFKLPLLAWGTDVKRACCVLASYDLLVTRGLDPAKGQDAVIMQRQAETTEWLRLIAAGKVTPNVTDSSPGSGPGIKPAGPRVSTGTQRGYSSRGTSGGRRGPFTGD